MWGSQDDGVINSGWKSRPAKERSKKSDSITVRLNLDAMSVQFFKNGDQKLLGEVTDIAPGTYQLAVSMYSRGEAVTVVG